MANPNHDAEGKFSSGPGGGSVREGRGMAGGYDADQAANRWAASVKRTSDARGKPSDKATTRKVKINPFTKKEDPNWEYLPSI